MQTLGSASDTRNQHTEPNIAIHAEAGAIHTALQPKSREKLLLMPRIVPTNEQGVSRQGSQEGTTALSPHHLPGGHKAVSRAEELWFKYKSQTVKICLSNTLT